MEVVLRVSGCDFGVVGCGFLGGWAWFWGWVVAV